MAELTSDPTDPRLGRGVDDVPIPQHDVYLVLSEEERAKGFVRPLRRAYKHDTCGAVTRMGTALCETYARDPQFYGATFCVRCSMHKPVSEFRWVEDNQGRRVMTPLKITPDIERAPWTDLNLAHPDINDGMLERIGLLRHGTEQGKASVGLVIELPDGTHVIGQTTWALFRMAYLALAASPVVAEEVIDP